MCSYNLDSYNTEDYLNIIICCITDLLRKVEHFCSDLSWLDFILTSECTDFDFSVKHIMATSLLTVSVWSLSSLVFPVLLQSSFGRDLLFSPVFNCFFPVLLRFLCFSSGYILYTAPTSAKPSTVKQVQHDIFALYSVLAAEWILLQRA